ncbi:YecH family protein [Vibrio sp. FNV 38]|nr:YecH family protein [Vibrio sp. FNV 38]
MSQEVHAHKILNLLREQPRTIEDLQQVVDTEFGHKVRFRTCKLNGFSLADLIDFFFEREKVVEIDGRLHINAENVCSHH